MQAPQATLGQAGASFAPKGSYKPPQRWLVSKKSASKAEYEVVDDTGQGCDRLVWLAVGAVLVLPALWLGTWTYRLIKSVQFVGRGHSPKRQRNKTESIASFRLNRNQKTSVRIFIGRKL